MPPRTESTQAKSIKDTPLPLHYKSSSESFDALRPSRRDYPKNRSRDSSPGTSTDGSDTESDVSYENNEKRQKDAANRLDRMRTQTQKLTEKLDKVDDIVRAKADKSISHRKVFNNAFNGLNLELLADVRHNLPEEIKQQQQADLDKLNKALAEAPGHSMDLIDPELKKKFFVAQYRGITYLRNVFDKAARYSHRKSKEEGEPVFASGAFEAAGITYGDYYQALAQKEHPEAAEKLSTYQKDLQEQAKIIKDALLSLQQETENISTVKARLTKDTKNFLPQNLSHIATHLYSSDMDTFKAALNDAKDRQAKNLPANDPLDRLFLELPSTGNPYVSTGDYARHADRYAFGLKPYKGHEDEILNPTYSQDGSRKHPYSGKLYVSLHPLEDYNVNGGATNVVVENSRAHNSIHNLIRTERETQIHGYIPVGRVEKTQSAKFPSFSKDYKPVYADTYGMTEDLYNTFKTAYAGATKGSPKQAFIDAALSYHLSSHADLKAHDTALRKALTNGTALVFRTGPYSFGFEPPKMENKLREKENKSIHADRK